MSSASQSPFRFVPTLTEIVRPNDFAATEMLEQQQLTDRLLQRIMPKVEAQLLHVEASVWRYLPARVRGDLCRLCVVN